MSTTPLALSRSISSLVEAYARGTKNGSRITATNIAPERTFLRSCEVQYEVAEDVSVVLQECQKHSVEEPSGRAP